MKIGVVGSKGVVGGACFFGFSKLGHDMVEHDLVIESKLEDVLGTDICFICVPTPSTAEGACDTSIVEKCVRDLSEMGYTGVVAIKSTVTPGTTEKLISSVGLQTPFSHSNSSSDPSLTSPVHV